MNEIYEEIKYICPLLDSLDSSESCAISREDVVKLQNDISAKIMVPTTIIQFKKTDNDEWDRIDSQLASISLRTSCNAFRTCARIGESLCKKNDSSHAEIFMNSSLNKIKDGALDYIILEQLPHADITLPTIHGKHTEHPYLKYFCYMLGYIELAFPIFLEEKVIGVLIVGQIKTFDNKALVQKTKHAFMSSHSNLFIDYVTKAHYDPEIPASEKKNKYTRKGIEDYILEQSNRSLNSYYKRIYENAKNMISVDIVDCLNNDEFNGLILNVQNCLHNFESAMKEKVRQKRNALIHSMIDNQIAAFAKKAALIYENPFTNIWKCVSSIINDIVQCCHLEYIAVFGYQNGITSINEQLRIRSFAGMDKGPLSQKELEVATNLFFTLAIQDEDIFEKYIILSEYGAAQAYTALFEKIGNKDTKDILLFPVKQTPNASIIMIINYGSLSLKEVLAPSLPQELQKFLTLLSSKLVAFIEYTNQQQYKKTLSMYRHETVHLIDTIRLPLQDYWNPDGRYFKHAQRHSSKYTDVYNDVQRTLNLIGALSASTNFMLHDLELEPEDIAIFKDIIFKWREIYNEVANDRFSTIRVPLVKANDSRRDFIHCDRTLMEIIAYNIISNAMKYSYKGTNLYIDCARDSASTRPVFSVTDFGNPIPETDDIYELYYQAPNRSGFIAGSGIGLYIVSMAVSASDMSITHKSRWISDYNIPLLWLSTEFYMSEQVNDSDLFQKLLDERHRLERTSIDSIPNVKSRRAFEAIISRSLMGANPLISWEEIEEAIHWPTYQVTFEVVI